MRTMASRRHVIADDLRSQIAAGRIKAGTRLPSEAQLAERYAVSTPTLRNALALLQAEGLVEKIHGKGNYVRRPLRKITYLGGVRTPEAQTAAGTTLHVSIRTTNLRARGHLTALLKVPARSPLTEFLCLTYEGSPPHSLARIYVPHDLAPADMPSELPWCREVEERLAELRSPLVEIREEVSSRLPTPQEAVTLRISSTLAVLAITRVAADATGRIVQAAHLVLPGDRANAVFTTHHTTEERGTEG